MSVRDAQESSLRLDRLESTRLAWAFGISLAIHLFCYGGYLLGEKTGLWRALNFPELLRNTRTPAQASEQQRAELTELPLIFVEVNPQFAAAEPPKDAKHYSDRNAQAANPDPQDISNVPRITGTQREIPKTEDVPRPRPEPLRPSPPAPPEPPAPAAESKPAPPGDLALMKPNATLRPEKPEPTRPRTLAELKPEQQQPGRKMMQEGGVARPRLVPTFDVRATAFGSYDRRMIDIIQSRWYSLLDQISYHGYRHGRVALQFRLNYDGRITDMKVLNQNVGETLSFICQQAILDPAPYDRWSTEMRQTIGRDYREITFTFLYE